MHVNLPDPSQFNIKDVLIAGDECILVTPKDMGVEWNEENKIFRSSIWRKNDMYPISLGYKKFMNYGEKPAFEPLPEDEYLEVIAKKDGSCLIVSIYKEELIVRTRGTADATQLENGYEIELLKKKYPKAFNNALLYNDHTFLFEWTTPSNRIVLQETQEPTLWLTGIVAHKDYSYLPQKYLDVFAQKIEVKRPKTYVMFAGEDIELLKKSIEPLNDIEGIVVYTGKGQILKKIKTLRYLQLHRVFTGIKTVDHLFDLFVEYGCLDREKFETLLATNFDWELVTSLDNLISELYIKWRHVKNMTGVIKSFLNLEWFKSLNRKEQAERIIKAFPKDSGIAFSILDGKDIAPHKLWKTYIQNAV
jgi:hypothetical protein